MRYNLTILGPAMSLQQLTIVFNLIGLGIVILVYWLVFPRARKSFFRTWVYGYSCAFVFVAIDFVGSFLGRGPVISVAWAAFVAATGWFFAQTGFEAQAKSLPRWTFSVYVGLSSALALGLSIAGRPFGDCGAVPALALAAAAFWLGSLFLRGKTGIQGEGMRWLGWPLVLSGTLIVTFPLAADTSFVWIGYWMGGPINLLEGIGMLVFQLKLLAHELDLKNQELTELDNLKTDFINVMSHELRTPLGAIKAAAFLLGDDMQKEEGLPPRQEFVDIILAHSNKLQDLVNDILDYARIESGSLPYDYDPEDLGQLALRVSRELRHLFNNKGVALEVDLDDAPMIFMLDRATLGRTLTNLLSNAIKFTPKGGTVKLSVHARGDDVEVLVQDTGVGIASQNLERIFTKFFQVDGSNTRASEGVGLGLSICKAVVEEGHAGRIWATSELGVGTTFHVVLPMREHVATDSPLAAVAARAGR